MSQTLQPRGQTASHTATDKQIMAKDAEASEATDTKNARDIFEEKTRGTEQGELNFSDTGADLAYL